MKSFDEYLIGDINLDGFQPVKGHYFSRLMEPSMTLRETSISFSIASYHALNFVASVQILVNEKEKRILVRPIASGEPYAVNWIKNTENPTSKPIECSAFTRPLFAAWNFEKKMRYRANGNLVKDGKNKLMLLFDFSSPEIAAIGKSVKNNGK